MKLKNINGKEVYKNLSRYSVDWDGKCRSKIQLKVKQFLKKHWKNHVVFEEMPVIGTRLTCDIVNMNKRIAVEIDGVQHGKFNKFFHNNDRENFLGQIKRDCKKEDWLEMNNIKLIRICETELKKIDDQKSFDELFFKILGEVE